MIINNWEFQSQIFYLKWLRQNFIYYYIADVDKFLLCLLKELFVMLI